MCRLIARKTNPAGPLTTSEISERSGLSLDEVRDISKLTSWESVPIGVADDFRRACGITPANERYHMRYLKNSRKNKVIKFRHLNHLHSAERMMIARTMQQFQKNGGGK